MTSSRLPDQGKIIDTLDKVKSLYPDFPIAKIDKQGICNFLSLFEGYYLSKGQYNELCKLYAVLPQDIESKEFDNAEHIKQLTSKFDLFCRAYNTYISLHAAGKRYNDLTLYYQRCFSENINEIGGITFRFDAKRVNELFSLLPTECILQCSSSNHTILIYKKDKMIEVRDPEQPFVFQCKQSDKLFGEFVTNALGELISFDVFTRLNNTPTLTAKFVEFIKKELQNMAIQRSGKKSSSLFGFSFQTSKESKDEVTSYYPVILNEVPSRSTRGIPYAHGTLLAMVKDAGHDPIATLLASLGASHQQAMENIRKANHPFLLKCIADNNTKMLSHFLSHSSKNTMPIDLNSETENLLIYAISTQKSDCVEELLNHPMIDVNRKDNLGTRPIIAALQNSTEDIVCLLLNTLNIDLSLTNLNVVKLCEEKNYAKALTILHEDPFYIDQIQEIAKTRTPLALT